MGTITGSFSKIHQYVESRKQVDQNQDEQIDSLESILTDHLENHPSGDNSELIEMINGNSSSIAEINNTIDNIQEDIDNNKIELKIEYGVLEINTGDNIQP